MKDAFPFHLVVNSNLEIIQLGDKLAKLIYSTNKYANVIHQSVEKYFSISTPPNYPWNWQQLIKLEDTTVELILLHSPNKISFRGAFFILDPEKDSYAPELSAMFLININILSIDEMSEHQLKLSDFPRHNFQRDLLIIGKC